MNGSESEGKKIVAEIEAEKRSKTREREPKRESVTSSHAESMDEEVALDGLDEEGRASDVTQYSDADQPPEVLEGKRGEAKAPTKAKRGRPKKNI